jgi:hypothetical protein
MIVLEEDVSAQWGQIENIIFFIKQVALDFGIFGNFTSLCVDADTILSELVVFSFIYHTNS